MNKAIYLLLTLCLTTLTFSMVESTPNHYVMASNLAQTDSFVLPEAYRERYAQWKADYYPNGGLSIFATDTASESDREKTWLENVKKIDDHNAKDSLYEEGVNAFTAMTEAELLRTETGLKPPGGLSEEDFAEKLDQFLPPGAIEQSLVGSETLSDQKEFAWNWIEKGAVSSVRSQGACGSCWAFAAMATVESAFKVEGGALLDLSEQQMVDCSKRDSGCNGGWMSNTYTYMKTGGVSKEADYPYKGRNGTCSMTGAKAVPGHKVTGFTSVPRSNENEMKHAVAKTPVSVAVCAGGWGSYSKGIFDNAKACGGGLNHGVVLVGYGKEGGVDYWIVRNSWGTRWGEGGNMKIKRNTGGSGMCKVAFVGYYPNVTVPAAPKPKPAPKPTPTPNGDCPHPWSTEACFKAFMKKLEAAGDALVNK